jgi:catechol 2,3-dioxygenase-like lactoylglutathione lyase family enzyme
MANWNKQIAAINLLVGDLDRAKTFYRDVFGLPVQHEDDGSAMFRFNDTYLFLQRGESRDDAPTEEVLKLAQGGVGQCAIIVEDADAVRAELDEKGVTVISGPEDRPWGMRTLTFADPGGNTWEIAQETPR